MHSLAFIYFWMTFEENICEPLYPNQKLELDSVEKPAQQKVLCNHCGRTANNGIKCIGRCVADNEY